MSDKWKYKELDQVCVVRVVWPETIKPFSAVCWLYAKYIYLKRGVPMGLVETSWGGTNIEAWSSPDSLHTCKLPSSNEQQKYKLCVFKSQQHLLGVPGVVRIEQYIWSDCSEVQLIFI